jgi:single-stranded-DNA-specific exonuclease
VQVLILEGAYEPTLEIDAHLPLGEVTLELVNDLERLAPFGPGNPNLVLASHNMQFAGARSLGRSEDHLLVQLEDQAGSECEVIWWGGGFEPLPGWMEAGAVLDLAYTARSRDYRGEKGVQVEWLEARPSGGQAIQLVPPQREIKVVDHRGSTSPLMELKQISVGEEKLEIWAEGEAIKKLAEKGLRAHHREDLEQADELAIWTTPPGLQLQSSVLEKVSPARIHLFAIDPGMDEVKLLSKRLLGLAKYAIQHNQGRVKISTLAAACAQRPDTVSAALQWLAARGYLALHDEGGGMVCLNEGDGKFGGELEKIETRLRDLLEETAAFRRYYAEVDAAALLGISSED